MRKSKAFRVSGLLIQAAAIALAGCSASRVSATQDHRLPVGASAGDMDLSPFYRWTAAPLGPAGTLLREEGLPEARDAIRAKEAARILYTSTDARWRSGPIPVSGTLFLPAGTPPPGGWPILAWGHGTLGIADICAPSWTGFRPRDATYINRWIDAGFAVVATDYQGLGGPGPHPYLYWQAEGRSILDSIRAALAARPGLIANRVMIAGQSQGSGAALGAAMLLREYAPELNVLGVVPTGLTSTFPDGPVSVPRRDSRNMFLSFASGGLKDDGPGIDRLLTAEGRQLLDVARRGCTAEIGARSRALQIRSLEQTLAVSMDELAAMRIAVTDMPMRSVGVPLMVATGLADATLTPERQYAAVAALCAAGNKVLWRRYEGLGHDGALNGSFEDSIAFARALLKGEPVASNCADILPPGPPGERKSGVPFNDD